MDFTNLIAEAEREEQEYYEQYCAAYEASVAANIPSLLLNQLEQNVATSLVIEREPTKGSLPTIFPTSRGIQKITFGAVFACQNGCLCVLSTQCPFVLNTFNQV